MIAPKNAALPLCLALFASACGGARPRPATAAPTATVGTSAVAEDTAAAEAPCTLWDPAADPTVPPLDVAAPPERARNGGDGLRFCILRAGTGQVRPTREQRVRVHYTGWTTDGEMFDSTRTRGEPAAFPVTGVIRGWVDSLTHMKVGELRRVWVPQELAYDGAVGMPAGMPVFDIQLVAIE